MNKAFIGLYFLLTQSIVRSRRLELDVNVTERHGAVGFGNRQTFSVLGFPHVQRQRLDHVI